MFVTIIMIDDCVKCKTFVGLWTPEFAYSVIKGALIYEWEINARFWATSFPALLHRLFLKFFVLTEKKMFSMSGKCGSFTIALNLFFKSFLEGRNFRLNFPSFPFKPFSGRNLVCTYKVLAKIVFFVASFCQAACKMKLFRTRKLVTLKLK